MQQKFDFLKSADCKRLQIDLAEAGKYSSPQQKD
jgi:hypothetical protein